MRLPSLAEAEGDPLGRPEGEALCPERFTTQKLAGMRRKMGEAAFSLLHQQRPAGLIFRAEWLRHYSTKDHPLIENGFAITFAPDRVAEEIQSWDMSFNDKATSDVVAGHVWRALGANCYLKPDRVRSGSSRSGTPRRGSSWSRTRRTGPP